MIVCVGEFGVVTVHICLSLSFTHTQSNTLPLFLHVSEDAGGPYWCVLFVRGLLCVYVCTPREIFFVCVYPGHIVWTGKMRMDGIVITEWRYPHSVKLEKAGRKPPTGTAAKERVVVMVIGEFKQGSTNLQGKRCECV